jgi:uncharacterized protein with GYD domain
MPRYVSLLRFTDQGIRGIKDSPKRAAIFADAAKKAGVEVESQLWTIGRYDGILILRADDEKKILQCLANLASQGNVRTESFRALDSSEFHSVVT